MRSRRVHKALRRLKRRLPTGPPFDRTLDYLSAWNRLEYRPNVRSPRTLNELFLASKHGFKGDMALARRVTDKVEFKEWLAETPEWEPLIVPTLGVFDSLERCERRIFDRDTILKPTHMSGPVLIFDQTRTLFDDEKKRIRRWLRTDYYRRSREPNYKGIRKRLILEPVLFDKTGEPARDFKFLVVRGRCLFVQVDHDRFGEHAQQFYSPDWNLLGFAQAYPRHPEPIDPPAQLDAALDAASALARPFPLCRVDLYLLPDGAIKAGELSFFPHAGAEPFTPPEADFELGRKARALMPD